MNRVSFSLLPAVGSIFHALTNSVLIISIDYSVRTDLLAMSGGRVWGGGGGL